MTKAAGTHRPRRPRRNEDMSHLPVKTAASKAARDPDAERREWERRRAVAAIFDRLFWRLPDIRILEILRGTADYQIVVFGNHTRNIRAALLIRAECERRGLTIDVPILRGVSPGRQSGRPFRFLRPIIERRRVSIHLSSLRSHRCHRGVRRAPRRAHRSRPAVTRAGPTDEPSPDPSAPQRDQAAGVLS